MNRFVIAVVLLAALFIDAPAARAWTRRVHDDSELVRRSELIVVARLKPASIRYLPTPEGGRQGWEHRATLQIAEVLKGTCRDKEIHVLFHYGLRPVVGGHLDLPNEKIDTLDKNYPKDIIEIHDTGSSGGGGSLVKDAREKNLWFLRRSKGPFEDGEVARELGIVEPEELQPPELKPYYQAHVAKNPEKAMKELVKKGGIAGSLAECYLGRQEYRRLAPTMERRALEAKLKPYLDKASRWQSMDWLAQSRWHPFYDEMVPGFRKNSDRVGADETWP